MNNTKQHLCVIFGTMIVIFLLSSLLNMQNEKNYAEAKVTKTHMISSNASKVLSRQKWRHDIKVTSEHIRLVKALTLKLPQCTFLFYKFHNISNSLLIKCQENLEREQAVYYMMNISDDSIEGPFEDEQMMYNLLTEPLNN